MRILEDERNGYTSSFEEFEVVRKRGITPESHVYITTMLYETSNIVTRTASDYATAGANPNALA
jgi:hypothetical protein